MTQQTLEGSLRETSHALGDKEPSQYSMEDVISFFRKWGWVIILFTITSAILSVIYAYFNTQVAYKTVLVARRTEIPNNNPLGTNLNIFKESFKYPRYSKIFFQQLSAKNSNFADLLGREESAYMDLFPLDGDGSSIEFSEINSENILISLSFPIDGLGEQLGFDVVNSINELVRVHNLDKIEHWQDQSENFYQKAVASYKDKEVEFLAMKEIIEPDLAELNMILAQFGYELLARNRSNKEIFEQFLAFPGSIQIQDNFAKKDLSVEEYQSLSIHTIRILGALLESGNVTEKEAEEYLKRYTDVKLKMSKLHSLHFKAEDDFKNAKFLYADALKKMSASQEGFNQTLLPKLAIEKDFYNRAVKSGTIETKEAIGFEKTVYSGAFLGFLCILLAIFLLEQYRMIRKKRVYSEQGSC